MRYYKEELINDDVSNMSECSYKGDDVIKSKKNKYYTSSIVGDYIVNAITGEKYPWRVGSPDEKRFFRVTDTTKFNDSSNTNGENRTSYKLFYESPHVYMKDRKIELDKELVKTWYNNINLLYPDEYTMPN
tara:strand:- start:234 stop:626 length:393 start_codon:yes stop_codon:yes gene_type:complete